MKQIRTFWLFLLLIALLFSVIAACGSDEPTSESPPESTVAVQLQPTFTATALPPPAETPPAETPTAIPVEPPTVAAALESPLTASAIISANQADSPIGAAGATECTISLNLDLSGYPDLKNLPTLLGCPQADAALDPVAINEFGGPDYDRFMLWFGSEKDIYVLFANQSWLAYSDTWSESEAEITCNPTNKEAISPPLPRRGFGKLWCTVEAVQKEMGLIDREERLCQHSVTQRFEKGRLLACFEDATIRYFRVFNDGRWDMMTVQ